MIRKKKGKHSGCKKGVTILAGLVIAVSIIFLPKFDSNAQEKEQIKETIAAENPFAEFAEEEFHQEEFKVPKWVPYLIGGMIVAFGVIFFWPIVDAFGLSLDPAYYYYGHIRNKIRKCYETENYAGLERYVNKTIKKVNNSKDSEIIYLLKHSYFCPEIGTCLLEPITLPTSIEEIPDKHDQKLSNYMKYLYNRLLKNIIGPLNESLHNEVWEMDKNFLKIFHIVAMNGDVDGDTENALLKILAPKIKAYLESKYEQGYVERCMKEVDMFYKSNRPEVYEKYLKSKTGKEKVK